MESVNNIQNESGCHEDLIRNKFDGFLTVITETLGRLRLKYFSLEAAFMFCLHIKQILFLTTFYRSLNLEARIIATLPLDRSTKRHVKEAYILIHLVHITIDLH